MGFLQSVRSRSSHFMRINLFFIIKRSLDIIVSMTLITFLAPLLLYISRKAYKHEGCPILYREARAGKNNQSFIMYTFRTTTNPSRVIRALPPHPFPMTWEKGVPDDFYFRRDENMMYTSTGNWLKKHGFYKLPQLFNVLKGDMSLIGPSPEVMEVASYYNRHQMNRLKVKPGMTGYAQINGSSKISHGEKIKRDLYYVQNYSYLLDAKILYRTFFKDTKVLGKSKT